MSKALLGLCLLHCFRQGKASVRLTDDFRRLGGLMLRNMSVLQVKLLIIDHAVLCMY